VNLDWTFLTALKCSQTRAAKRVTKQGEAQLKLTIITRISDVNATYFDLLAATECLRLYNCNFKPTLNLGAKSFYHRKSF
jgi:outer membrane protein TolC